MPDRVTLVLKNGTIVPCNGCKLRRKCRIYRQAMRLNRYHRPSNILGYCDIWEPETIERGKGRSLTWKGFKRRRPN